jgi:amphi-Trp domain-containing protein
MGKKENNSKQIELNSRTDLAEVTEQLQQLVDGLDAGEVTIAAGTQRVTLAPTETVEMRFQARQKDRDERITIELRWQRTTTPTNGQQIGRASCRERV